MSTSVVPGPQELFPEPLTPVKTVSLFLGISTLMFFKLCSLAPLITNFFLNVIITYPIFLYEEVNCYDLPVD